MKVLVTSAGGKTGMHVVTQLCQRGVAVRALLRREDQRAVLLRQCGAEVVICNQYSVTVMREALSDITHAYLCLPTASNGLYFANVFAAAASGCNQLKHVVQLSQWLSCEDHPSLFTRETWLAEQLLQSLDATSTVVDTGWFAENYFMVLEPAVQLGMLPMPLGDGDQKKDVGASSEDIAAVVVACLLDANLHAGKRYRPTGPALISPNDVAAAIGSAAKVKVAYQDMPEAMFLKAMYALKPPMFSPAAVSQLNIYMEEYRRGIFAVGGPTTVVADVGGKQPESIEAMAERLVKTRPEAQKGLGNKLIALKNFMKIVVTPKPNMDKVQQTLNQVVVSDAPFAQDSEHWKSAHLNRV